MERCEDCILYDECLRKGCGEFKPKEKPMKDKSCKNCKHYSQTDPCGFFNCSDNNFKMFEPMENKVIFESRKDIVNFGMLIKNCMDEEHLIQTMASYDISFRKSPVEEAEEYEKHIAEIMDKGMSASIKDLEWSIRIIRELKAENERLKKC